MDTVTKYFKLNINKDYLETHDISVNDFFKFKSVRNTIVSALLNTNISFKSYNILNIIYINNIFVIELEIIQFNTSIIKFDSLQKTLLFCLYLNDNNQNKIKNKTQNLNSNLSLYLLNNTYYLIIENQDTYNIKFSDFEFIKYSPLIHSKILECGFKLSI